jgi:localization factor PodJL
VSRKLGAIQILGPIYGHTKVNFWDYSFQMATNSPWSVKGVAPEAREAAKIAARRQGVNVGRWLSQTILATASEELRSKRGDEPNQANQPAPSASFTFDGQPISDPVPTAPPPQQQAQQPTAQQQPAQPHYDPSYPPTPPAPAPGTSSPPALTPEAVLASIQKLATRIEESENRTAEVLKPIAEKVGELGSQIDHIKANSGGSSAPVERAMMRLSERLDRMEEPGKKSGSSGGRPSKTSSSGGVMGRLFGRD